MNTTNPIKLSMVDVDSGASLGQMFFFDAPNVGDRVTPKNQNTTYKILFRSHWQIDEHFGYSLYMEKI